MRSNLARGRRRYRTLWPPGPLARPQTAPDRARALLAVSIALRDGRLEQLPCEVCGAAEGVEAYHDDPAAPLDVRWLCPVHMKSPREAHQ